MKNVRNLEGTNANIEELALQTLPTGDTEHIQRSENPKKRLELEICESLKDARLSRLFSNNISIDDCIAASRANRPSPRNMIQRKYAEMLENCGHTLVETYINNFKDNTSHTQMVAITDERFKMYDMFKTLDILKFFNESVTKSVADWASIVCRLNILYCTAEYRHNNAVPYGYTYDAVNNTLVIDPVKASHIRKLFELHYSDVASDKIAKQMEEITGGAVSSVSTIRGILANPVYMGHQALTKKGYYDENHTWKRLGVNDIIYIPAYEPIVTADVFYNKRGWAC